MIDVKAVAIRARMMARDMNATTYSPYETMTAIKAAVDILCEALKKHNAAELMRREILKTLNSSVMLPDGFLSVVTVENDDGISLSPDYEAAEIPEYCYRIEGNYLLTLEPTVTLVYMKDPYGDKRIDLPAGYTNALSAIAANVLKGESDAAVTNAENAAISKKDDKRGITLDPPMWGG